MLIEVGNMNRYEMKVIIWVRIDDVITNNISEFHTNDTGFKYTHDPEDYVQIMVSREEFVRLEEAFDERKSLN
jgi:hypothetical protein